MYGFHLKNDVATIAPIGIKRGAQSLVGVWWRPPVNDQAIRLITPLHPEKIEFSEIII